MADIHNDQIWIQFCDFFQIQLSNRAGIIADNFYIVLSKILFQIRRNRYAVKHTGVGRTHKWDIQDDQFIRRTGNIHHTLWIRRNTNCPFHILHSDHFASLIGSRPLARRRPGCVRGI